MKKHITMLMVLFVLLCGCTQENNKLLPIEQTYNESSEIVITTQKTVYSTEDTEIEYVISNPTSEEKDYGTYLYLHKFHDGKWNEVAFKYDNMYFEDILFILQPNQEKTETLKLDNCFNLPLEKGEYRIFIDGGSRPPIISNTFTIE